ncbi:MAG TPA: hypothetical protein VNQ76_16525 [Planctomicrobium sp.]|nr:hypothetical protein [Planctomicrobium sp.]
MPHSPTVVKVGGSLLDLPELPVRLNALMKILPSSILLIVGGGGFADEVRRLDRIHDWPESLSHRVAMRSMSVGATLLSRGLSLPLASSWEQAQHMFNESRAVVVDIFEWENVDELPASWDLTSDSIAAWLTEQCKGERLVLAKSVDLPDPVKTLDELSSQGFLDPCFPSFSSSIPEIDWVNLRSASSLKLKKLK